MRLITSLVFVIMILGTSLSVEVKQDKLGQLEEIDVEMDKEIDKQEKFISQPPLAIDLGEMGFKAEDIGVGAEGDTYAIGADGRLYHQDQLQNTYRVVEGDEELPKLSKVDVDADGTPYVVAALSGETYYLDENNNWILLPGCARDIGVGRGGEVWKVGCDDKLGGHGIWKLICPCEKKCNCNSRQSTRFRLSRYLAEKNEHQHQNKCYWHRIEGGGKSIDVDPTGNPWIVAENHKVFMFDGDHWRVIPGFKAQDISVSNEGVVFASGFESDNLGRLVCGELGTWQLLNAPSKHVSVGPYSLPFIINTADLIQSTTKKSFN